MHDFFSVGLRDLLKNILVVSVGIVNNLKKNMYPFGIPCFSVLHQSYMQWFTLLGAVLFLLDVIDMIITAAADTWI